VSLQGLATALTVLLAGAAACGGLAAAFFMSRASTTDDFLNSAASLSDLNDADSRVGTGVALFFIVFAATGVVFIIWQFRHAKNAEALRGSLPLGPGWAIGGWFIPLANYVLPAVQIGQAAKASDPDLPPGEPRSRGRLPGIVVAWAIVFAVGAGMFIAASSSRPNEDQLTAFNARSEIQDFARADREAAIGMFVYAAAAVLALLMVRQLTERQRRAAASMPQSAYQPQAYLQYPQQQYPQQQYPGQQYPAQQYPAQTWQPQQAPSYPAPPPTYPSPPPSAPPPPPPASPLPSAPPPPEQQQSWPPPPS
jgi:hypothetical protein